MYGIGVRGTERGGLVLELRGDFDIFALDDLRGALEHAAALHRPAVVDLSGVTFMDARTTRELAVRCQLYGHYLRLVAPSWPVERSVRACGLQDWVVFDNRYGAVAHPPIVSEVS